MVWKSKVKTVLAELAIGIAIVIIAILYATRGPFAWMPHRRWITLAIITCGAFGVPVWWYRERWIRPLFWLWFAALLTAHVMGHCIVLARTREFPPLLAAISVPVEWLVIFPILKRASRGTASGRPDADP